MPPTDPASERPPAPFIVGVSRSGTTLVRLMLDAHPALAIPAETRFLPELIERIEAGAEAAEAADFLTGHERWVDFGLDAGELRSRFESLDPFGAGPAARAFYTLYADRQRKPRWGDKSPPYGMAMPAILGALPEATFIHVIRDGRDVALSLMSRAWGMRRPRRIAKRWVEEVGATRRDGAMLSPGRYLEVRYEELVVDPEAILRGVCVQIGLEFDPAMLAYHERAGTRLAELGDLGARSATERKTQFQRVQQPLSTDRVALWRSEMSAPDREAFEAVAGELLGELGYPTQ